MHGATVFTCLLVMLLCLNLPVYAQKSKKSLPTVKKNSNSLIWEIRTPEGKVNHVFGTIHLRDTAVFFQRDTVLVILSKAHQFFAELNFDSTSAGGMDPSVMMMPPGKSLADYFTPEQLVVVRKVLREKLGPMSTMAERLKPAAIVPLLMIDSFEATATVAVDEFLWNYAKESGLLVDGVETILEQLEVMDKIPASALYDMVTDPESQDSMASVLVQAYADENLGLVSILIEEAGSMEGFMAALNDDRNEKIVERMVPFFKTGKTFIAVGAAHLPGKNGLLQRFRNLGYEVIPVMGGRRTKWLQMQQ